MGSAETASPAGGPARLTDQQARAVAARGVSVVLSSGAGCGKTHVLTERYLSHLRDDGAEVGQVVAITFTDRAAREMRGRIRRAVHGHLRAAPDDAAAEVWARHLRALEAAQISTIHAFCGALLRQSAFEAGLDPHFEVLEEVLAVNLQTEALDDCLQKLLTAQAGPGDDLRQLVLLYGWRPVVEAVGRLLQVRDEARWRRWLDTPPAEAADAWGREARQVVLPRYVEYLCAARPKVARCLALLEQHPPRPGPMADNVRRLLDGLPRLAEAADLGAAAEELVEAAKVGRVGVKAWPDPAVYEQIKGALEGFREELRGQGLEWFDAAGGGLEEAAAVGQRFLRVAAAAAQAYRDRKRALGLVDFQDLLVAARDLLRDRPEVRARVQDRYRFVLVDELQDTDPVQVELVESLCGGGLTAGKLFAVGDHKQSIYRFRGAEVRLFEELRRRVPHEGRQGLTVNFRSQPAILDFTNALLSRRLAGYEPLVAHEPQVNPGPCVEFLWAPRPEKASAAEARAAEADWIAARIAAMVNPGGPELVVERGGGPGRLRPARPGDVVLLFRAMSNVHLYEAALRRRGLHYYLVGGRAFFAQQEVYDLLNLLRALENPQDAVSLAGTLRSPFCCLSDEALFVLARHPGGLWAGLLDETLDDRLPADQRGRVARARRHLARWSGLKDRRPIARLLGAVFADSGFDAATQFEFLGDRKLANLWKLVELARTFDRSGLFGLAEFIARLGDLVRTQPREEQAATQPENADVVRLMSIHQAKGLEFLVVFVPDFGAAGGGAARPAAEWDAGLGCVARPPADEEEPPFPDFGWRLGQARNDLEDWHEDLRTLYVACTRARDYLVLSAALPEGLPATNTWTLTLTERFDPATGRCLAADVPAERRPLIRVHDRDRPPPAPPAARAVEAGPAPPANGAGEDGRAAAAFVPQATGRPCVAVGEWRRHIDPSDSDEGTSGAGSPRWSLDAEDCSGLSEWLTPRERATGCVPPASERLVRAALAAWDFREPDVWRGVLCYAVPADATAAAEAALERFARSAPARDLAAAAALHRDVEFHLDLAEEFGRGERLPTVRGVADCVWQDAAGAWHLLGFTAGAEADAEWDTLALAAAALRRQTGDCPAGVALYDLTAGRVVREARGADEVGRVVAEWADGLTGRGRRRRGR
jgi:ATP-dependent helicase/nuclease subunit A